MDEPQSPLDRLNAAPSEEAAATLLACCGSTAWARAMAARRPFANPEAVFAAHDLVWTSLGADDRMEAFRAHPRIGEKKGGAQPAVAQQWSAAEQSRAQADDARKAALAALNVAYEARYGHIFIVCASGRSAEEILENARSRMDNPPDVELQIAAEEQRRITRLRLERLLGA